MKNWDKTLLLNEYKIMNITVIFQKKNQDFKMSLYPLFYEITMYINIVKRIMYWKVKMGEFLSFDE